jgi:hypothetical protein
MQLPVDINDKMRRLFKENFVESNPDSMETALQSLKDNGYSQMQSIFLLIDVLQLSFIEANRVILNSKAWNK